MHQHTNPATPTPPIAPRSARPAALSQPSAQPDAAIAVAVAVVGSGPPTHTAVPPNAGLVPSRPRRALAGLAALAAAATSMFGTAGPAEALASSRSAIAVSALSANGYTVHDAQGGEWNFGAASATAPSLAGQRFDGTPVDAARVRMANGIGRIVTTDRGAVYTSGAAPYRGGVNQLRLNAPIVAVVADVDANGGYVLVAGDGGTFYHSMDSFGSLAGTALDGRIVDADLVQSSTGAPLGIVMTTDKGAVYALGRATYPGGVNNLTLNQPIVAIVSRSNGQAWLVAADGGLHALGGAPFVGSLTHMRLNAPIVDADGIGSTVTLIGADGGVFALGTGGQFFGSAAELGGTWTPPAGTSEPYPSVACPGGGSIPVAASIAQNVTRLLAAANAAPGRHALCGGGYRSSEDQQRLRDANGCPDRWISPSSSCRVPTAIPGNSMHERGLAVDFRMVGGASLTPAAFDWLQANAATYGLQNFPKERWHWSTTGT